MKSSREPANRWVMNILKWMKSRDLRGFECWRSFPVVPIVGPIQNMIGMKWWIIMVIVTISRDMRDGIAKTNIYFTDVSKYKILIMSNGLSGLNFGSAQVKNDIELWVTRIFTVILIISRDMNDERSRGTSVQSIVISHSWNGWIQMAAFKGRISLICELL